MADLRRRALAALLAAALAAAGAGCGDDGGDGDGARPPADGSGDADGDERPGDGDDRDGGDQDEDDDEGDGRASGPVELPAGDQPYADAIAEVLSGPSYSPEAADCIASRIVALLGSDAIEAGGLTPEAFAEDPFAVLGRAPDRALAEEVYDVMDGCGAGYREVLLDQMLAGISDSPSVRACLEDVLTEDLLREQFIDAMVERDGEGGTFRFDPEVEAAAEACVEEGG